MSEISAQRIKVMRKLRGLTQRNIADRLFVEFQSVHRWERGTEPNYDVLIKLSEILDCTVDYLVGKTDSMLPVIITDYLNKFE